jgi:hypothetical protein
VAGVAYASVHHVCTPASTCTSTYLHPPLQATFPLGSGATLTLMGDAGVLLPWGSGALGRPTPISDRFFLGGLAGGALRGFSYKGVGPSEERRRPAEESEGGEGSGQEQQQQQQQQARSSGGRGGAGGRAPLRPTPRDALGGDLFFSFLADLSFPLPNRGMRAMGLQGHAFLNGGNIVALSGPGASIRDRLHELNSTIRWSVVSAAAAAADQTLSTKQNEKCMQTFEDGLTAVASACIPSPRPSVQWLALTCCAGRWAGLGDSAGPAGGQPVAGVEQAGA